MGTLLAGINHVAVVTEDLDRLLDFYVGALEVEVVESFEGPGFRMCVVDAGAGRHLNIFEIAGNEHGAGLPDMFQRGHLDHLGLDAADEAAFWELRRRMTERGAADESVTDFGPQISFLVRDPDGMELEICLVVDATLPAHARPRPYAVQEPAGV